MFDDDTCLIDEARRPMGRCQAFSKSMELEPEAGDYPKCRGEVYQLMGEHEMVRVLFYWINSGCLCNGSIPVVDFSEVP